MGNCLGDTTANNGQLPCRQPDTIPKSATQILRGQPARVIWRNRQASVRERPSSCGSRVVQISVTELQYSVIAK